MHYNHGNTETRSCIYGFRPGLDILVIPKIEDHDGVVYDRREKTWRIAVPLKTQGEKEDTAFIYALSRIFSFALSIPYQLVRLFDSGIALL